MDRRVTLVLKGQRTVIAFPDGRVWINPTGTPALGTGGTGDVLTGMIAGFLAQFPSQPDQAVAAAVYLHGLAGEIGARALGEKCLIATDILHIFRTPWRSVPTYRTASEEETIALGERLARALPVRGVVLLTGNLGAGKTTLAKGIVSGLGRRRPRRYRAPLSPSSTNMETAAYITWISTAWKSRANWPPWGWRNCSSGMR